MCVDGPVAELYRKIGECWIIEVVLVQLRALRHLRIWLLHAWGYWCRCGLVVRRCWEWCRVLGEVYMYD